MHPHTMFTPIFIALTSLFKFEICSSNDDLKELNKLLKEKLAPINYHLGKSNNPDDIKILGDQANEVIREFLMEHPEAFEQVEASKKSKFKNHNSKTLEEAIKLKKELRKKVEGPNSTIEDTKRFRLALRAISDLRKLEKKKDQIKTAKNQEELYFKNKWDFAKKACKGSLEAVPELPGFSKTLADEYYPSTYSIPKIIDLSSLN